MKKSELRIGNWVAIHRTEIEMLEGDFSFDDSFFNPIPITKEWLLILGFEYIESYDNYRVTTNNHYYNSIQFYDKEWHYNNDSSDAGCYYVSTIKYVHQLQNLYFAINDIELKTPTD